MKIVVLAEPNELVREVLNADLPNAVIEFAQGDDVIVALRDAVVVIPERYPLSADIMNAAPELRLIHCGTGSNHVDVAEATRRNILVATTPDVVAPSVAEYVYACIHHLYKRIASIDADMKHGRWQQYTAVPNIELAGKTLGLLGFGNIARRVSRIGAAYGMTVCVHRQKEDTEGEAVELVTAEELFRRADIVSVHVPLTAQTEGSIGRQQFQWMKNSAILINTARGAILNEADLIDALKADEIAGAVLDVFRDEPLPADSALRQAPHAVLTPHIAFYTVEAVQRRYKAFAENIDRLTKKETLHNLI